MLPAMTQSWPAGQSWPEWPESWQESWPSDSWPEWDQGEGKGDWGDWDAWPAAEAAAPAPKAPAPPPQPMPGSNSTSVPMPGSNTTVPPAPPPAGTWDGWQWEGKGSEDWWSKGGWPRSKACWDAAKAVLSARDGEAVSP